MYFLLLLVLSTPLILIAAIIISYSFNAQIIRFVPYIYKGLLKRNLIKRYSNKKIILVKKKRITLSKELSTSSRVLLHLAVENNKDLKS
ncbi:hypothetical protein HBI45_241040 [Parastagonospora nodorum]|nr:hypothetical protein HBI45_241040 [Parastagonospora nodorum]